MKRVVRTNVFETNSSSSHSLIVTKRTGYFTREEINEDFWICDDGLCTIWDTSVVFGRSPDRPLYTFREKLNYLLAYYGDNRLSGEKIEELKAICAKYIDGFVDFHTNGEEEYGNRFSGYIDHQSLGLLDAFFKSHPEVTLEEFLIRKDIVIVIDGDEYGMLSGFVDAGLIDVNFVKEEYGSSDILEELAEYNYEED